jgi:hypothetical protein
MSEYVVKIPPGLRSALRTDELKTFFLWVQTELDAISRYTIDEIDLIHLRVLAVAPEKPRAGMLAYADGSNWDPGSGEGLYRYSSGGAWVFIG